MAKLQVAPVRFFFQDQWTCYLKIEGIGGRFNIAQYSATFAKNEVPTATCLLGTGVELARQGTLMGASVHSLSSALAEELAELDGAEMIKASVHLDLGPWGNVKSEWEPGGREIFEEEQTIFEGYYAGVSYNRVGPQIQMSVNLVHRLVDLTFGSLWSGWMHPSNDSNLLQPAAASTMGGPCPSNFNSGGEGESAWQASNFLKERMEAHGGTNFGDALLGTLHCVAQMDVFKLDCENMDLPKTPNTAAQEVLDKIMSKTGALRSRLQDEAFLASISAYMGRLIDDTRGTTFWDFLVNKMCPDFIMALIPLPSLESSPDNKYAYLVPDTPGLKTPYKELYLNDYSGFDMKARLWKPLYAVGVYSDGDDMSGSELGSNPQTPRAGAQCIGGIFPNPSMLDGQKGQLLLIRAPEWLKDLAYLTDSLDEFGDTGKAAHDAIDTDQEFSPPTWTPSEKRDKKADILADYAKLFYVQNAINGRAGTFDSKLRFDIAPGSILKINKKARAGTQGKYQELPVDVYVQVNRVSYNINSESPQAKTSFECVHLRTAKENDDDALGRYSIDKHVFLEGEPGFGAAAGGSTTWTGAPLIEKWAF